MTRHFPRELRDASFIPRWATARIQRSQSIAEHQFYTTVYAIQIVELLDLDRINLGRLAKIALTHDLEETFTSDIPGPVKRAIVDTDKMNDLIDKELEARFPDMWRDEWFEPPVNAEDYALVVKAASLMDEVMFLATERQMGNQACEDFRMHSFARLEAAWRALPGDPDKVSRTWASVMVPAILSAKDDQSRIVVG